MSREQGRRHCLFMDSKGLVCASRTDLQHHKVRWRRRLPTSRRWLVRLPDGALEQGRALTILTPPFDVAWLRHPLCRCRPASPPFLQKPFAHDVPHCKTLLEAIGQMKPTVLIGVSTIAGAFSQEVLKVRERGVFSGVG